MVYGLGMNNGYGQMGINNFQQAAVYPRTGSVMQSLKDKYGCEDCFIREPYFAHYPIGVQQLPESQVRPSIITRISNRIFGG